MATQVPRLGYSSSVLKVGASKVEPWRPSCRGLDLKVGPLKWSHGDPGTEAWIQLLVF
jgi:hypothetical protein